MRPNPWKGNFMLITKEYSLKMNTKQFINKIFKL